MFDTMTITKIGAAFCGALLVLTLGNWVGAKLYNTGEGHHGGDHKEGFHIEVAEANDGPVEEGPSFADLYAVADLEKGERVFRKCSACHSLAAGEQGTGPTLYNIVDRAVSAEPGFPYSGSLIAVAPTWSVDNLDAFLANPKGFAPGTAMGFAGLKKIEDRANLIAYLATISG